MRINKFLSLSGFGGRRVCDKLIADGKVTVNGKVCTLGQDVDPTRDNISVDGVIATKIDTYSYYLINKPKGYICSVRDEKDRKTVLDLLPENARNVYPVGRLDYDSEGMLILTNDGDLAFRLTHPSNEIPKVYLVRIEGTIDDRDLNKLRAGVEIDGRLTKKCKISVIETHRDYTKLHVTLTEGRNREIRKMFDAVGKNVDFLKRLRIGDLSLRGLDRGSYRKLTPEEVFYLKNL